MLPGLKAELCIVSKRSSFFPDLSAELLHQRRHFDCVKQQLRSLNINYGLIYPAKLDLTVDGQSREFEDPSDAEKLIQGIQCTV